jgi:hypothetical protein
MFELLERFKGFNVVKLMQIKYSDGKLDWVTTSEWNKGLKDREDITKVLGPDGNPLITHAVGIHYKDKDQFHTYYIEILKMKAYEG